MEKDQNTEAKIMAAAREIFHQKGMAGARMQEIADKAGINKALLHYYFRNKRQLFMAIFQESFQSLMPEVNEILTADMPLFEKIEAFVDRYLDLLEANPAIPMFVLNEIRTNPESIIGVIQSSGGPNLQAFFKQVQQEVDAGNIQPVDPRQLMINIISLCVFPQLGRPMIQRLMKADDQQFNDILQARKTHVSQFIINAIKL